MRGHSYYTLVGSSYIRSNSLKKPAAIVVLLDQENNVDDVNSVDQADLVAVDRGFVNRGQIL
jgi:hypothetical protein